MGDHCIRELFSQPEVDLDSSPVDTVLVDTRSHHRHSCESTTHRFGHRPSDGFFLVRRDGHDRRRRGASRFAPAPVRDRQHHTPDVRQVSSTDRHHHVVADLADPGGQKAAAGLIGHSNRTVGLCIGIHPIIILDSTR